VTQDQSVGEVGRAPATRGDPILRIARDGPLPLSSSEEVIWNYAKDPQVSAAYVRAIADLIRGPLDVAVLVGSLEDLIERHEILRCTFAVVGGRPQHVVHPPAPLKLPIRDAEPGDEVPPSVVAFAGEAIARVANLARKPLFQVVLFRAGDGRHWLLRICHQIIWDAWSHGLFYQELRRFYEARRAGAPLREPAESVVQYIDYAAWERRQAEIGTDRSAAIAWWRKVYANPKPTTSIRFRRRRSSRSPLSIEGMVKIVVRPAVLEQVDQFRREARTTNYLLWLSAFTALLSDEMRSPQVPVIGYATMRRRPEMQGILGFFTNTVTYPFTFDPGCSFREWQSSVRLTVREADAHHGVTKDDLARHGVIIPPSQVIFGYIEIREVKLGDLVFWPKPVPRSQMPWGFTLTIGRVDGQTSAFAAFDAREHNPDRVQLFIDRLIRFVAAALAQPDAPLGGLLRQCRREPGQPWWRRWMPSR
jgi:hypothetical protein